MGSRVLTEKQRGFCGWVRIDDRLIHGQVTVGWRQYLRYQEIWVVDDLVRGDPYLWDALQLATPVGIEVRGMGLQEAIEVLTEDATPNAASVGGTYGGSVLMLLRSPKVGLALLEGGVLFGRVNVGNLGARPGSVRAMRSISLTQDDVDALDALTKRGVEVFFQLTPEDARVEWEVVRRRMYR
jgi:mannose/fructose/N-acetylgalactosamine-specific phosphotransferase system component IIB